MRRESQEMERIRELLEDFPTNASANAVAAKLLYVQGRCEEGAIRSNMAYSRGVTFPSLELTVRLDGMSCNIEGADDALSERLAISSPRIQHRQHYLTATLS